MTTDEALDRHPIVLFDGVCNLCNTAVGFILCRDPQGAFRFASLQSETGQRLMKSFAIPGDRMESLLLLEGKRCFSTSTAALRIARRLRWPWPLAYGFILIPRPVRDAVYRFIALRRYRWFGRRESCMIPTPEMRSRFLDGFDE